MDISFSKPQKCAVKVPSGRLLVNHRWRNSSVGKELISAGCQVIYSDGLGFVDFFPADTCAVIYITEAELLSPKSFTTRTTSLFKEYNHRGIIIADRGKTAGYEELQDLACMQLDLTVLPIINQNEIPCILNALSHTENRQPNNPFKSLSPGEEDMEKQQISLLKQIPTIGDKTAIKLLKSYGHITAISKLSEERLSTKIGKADAEKVYKYFRNKVFL